MPYLLCLSPIILDQTFPRNEEELRIVAEALGELENFIHIDKAHLVSTNILREFLENIDGTAINQSLLWEVYRFLSQLFLRQDGSLIDIDKYIKYIDDYSIKDYYAHPVPKKCQSQGYIEFWSDELGKILYVHDKSCNSNNFFIGVACAYGFAGECVDEYNNPNNHRAFPLVSPDNVENLADAYEWVIPTDIHQKSITIENIKKNYRVIGGMSLEKPNRDSHFKVKFQGKRSWSFSINDNPVPESYIRELVDITSYPVEVIKTALTSGSLPQKCLKLKMLSQ
ncbi:hypothetical protein NIES37_51240 [Tolypothrix tenuis PCC 7101]|uniref:Uncharacterized protein n=1 Tax=Tolypothrix tenuis PCC 7101 TaxID=231146 RepID=A0A1Z4N5Y3_9CYAN|nr:hypothetical protein [Aulosira sp. FACHB-113]BAZ01126.1 hypothetical protein NIES37_51240 [Tolypothrix tenuis PCC 7101]BAZ74952.1 hypothetical protein NIES50_35320 [Aulosira laxa NIES-50]